jgi:hypothetical protein
VLNSSVNRRESSLLAVDISNLLSAGVRDATSVDERRTSQFLGIFSYASAHSATSSR